VANYRDKLASWDKSLGQEKMATDLAEVALLGSMMGSNQGSAATQSKMLLNKTPYLLGAKALNTTDPAFDTLGYRLNRFFHGGFKGLMDRVKADEIFAKTVVDGLSQTTFEVAKDTLADSFSSASKAMYERNVASPTRVAILDQLKKEDDIIGAAGQKNLLEAYHTMKTFAPSLSIDKNAVKSFLRQAVQHEGGIDYVSIKGLAEAENAITGKPRDR
jgi:hypothetical protein